MLFPGDFTSGRGGLVALSLPRSFSPWLDFLKPSGRVGAGRGVEAEEKEARPGTWGAAGKAEGLAATDGLFLCAQRGELPFP